MKKFSEFLTEKYLSKIINEKTLEICKRDFDCEFDYSCKYPNSKDTILGSTFRRIEETAQKEIWEYFNQECKKVMICFDGKFRWDFKKNESSRSPFFDIVDDLLGEFLDNLDFRGYLENIIGDEWKDKEKELIEKKVIDQNGELLI